MRSPWGAGAPDKAQSSAELIERRKSPLIFVHISQPPPPHSHRHGQSGGQHSTGQASGRYGPTLMQLELTPHRIHVPEPWICPVLPSPHPMQTNQPTNPQAGCDATPGRVLALDSQSMQLPILASGHGGSTAIRPLGALCHLPAADIVQRAPIQVRPWLES